MDFKECTNLKELPEGFEWDTSNITELKSLDNMNEKQAKYCLENNLLYNYPMSGMAALIDGKIKKWFNAL